MHDQVLDPADGHGAACPACESQAASEELRVRLPSAEAITTLGDARAAIDGLDAALAALLERRAAIAAVVQRLKPVGGFAGRDPERERRIVEAMAEHAPALGPDRLARIMNAVIETGLDAAADR
ncbi:chorismate mutase [Actinomadura rubrisoli]|uniref:Chorismate mutase n=1 Tax=Actinomadura rubrisoli TaxID=2530368 RepID=A0A4R5A0T7_9ACTN|nr:chorismate mutase [Actinomadura rubrisoli]TDD64069.1 chorismate mutase [Actinomadura rubrisoli]